MGGRKQIGFGKCSLVQHHTSGEQESLLVQIAGSAAAHRLPRFWLAILSSFESWLEVLATCALYVSFGIIITCAITVGVLTQHF